MKHVAVLKDERFRKVENRKSMERQAFKWLAILACGVLIVACGGGTKLTKRQIDENRKGKPVSNLLVIAVTYDQEVRRSFENKMVASLKATGIEAVTSVDVIPISEKQQLKKEKVLEVVGEFGNDAALITHLIYTEDKEIITRDLSGVQGVNPLGSPGSSSFLWSYGNAYSPGLSSSNITIRLITNLYDVETEKLIWSGESETSKPKSLNQLIDDVIKVVLEDLKANKLL
jgi:hypothetical protein